MNKPGYFGEFGGRFAPETLIAPLAELESAYQRQDPVLLWVYAPHWAPSKYEGEWVQFPEYSAECYNDPSVGVNPDMAYDCGKPRGPIWKVAWAGVKDKWPGAYTAPAPAVPHVPPRSTRGPVGSRRCVTSYDRSSPRYFVSYLFVLRVRTGP